ncbi:hypothetical protein BC832DRAFT_363759 [Gaertneriomyces semiglobifer]|nr:hypothetical protein BC832DRAFT_363759 [Gaertneriomyces semiglobifer]
MPRNQSAVLEAGERYSTPHLNQPGRYWREGTYVNTTRVGERYPFRRSGTSPAWACPSESSPKGRETVWLLRRTNHRSHRSHAGSLTFVVLVLCPRI